MEPKEPRRKKPVRVSAVDYVASLVRSPLYVADFETFRKREAQVQGAADLAMIGDVPGAPERDFLARWPILRKPIPPAEAKKAPADFVSFIVPAVVFAKDTPESWDDPRTLANLPWPAARFHPVFINLFRTEKEILAEVKKLLRDTRIDGVRMSGQREKTRDKGAPDRWRTWDVYQGEGRADVRKTAAILFRTAFNERTAKRELKTFIEADRIKLQNTIEEAKRRGEARIRFGNRLRPFGAAINALQEKHDRMIMTPGTRAKRKKLLSSVARDVRYCRELVDAHKPFFVDRNSVLTRVY